MPIRRQPDPIPNGPNFGIINTGHMTGPAQAAPFSQNATQTNNITNEAVDKARDSIDDLRRAWKNYAASTPRWTAPCATST